MENEKKTPNRKRSIILNFRITEDEKALILAKNAIVVFAV